MNFSRAVAVMSFLWCFFCIAPARAQFQAIYIGVNGLTCSQCSRTVEMSIRKLDFVADVQMNLEHTEGKILVKTGKKADMAKIAQAIFDAGFSVRYLQADLMLNNSISSGDQCFSYQGDEYVFVPGHKQPISGTVHLKFIGKKFLPKNEFKKMEPLLINKCSAPGTGKTYFVAI